jgi:molecular chaperone GrpE (heat shock protein)
MEDRHMKLTSLFRNRAGNALRSRAPCVPIGDRYRCDQIKESQGMDSEEENELKGDQGIACDVLAEAAVREVLERFDGARAKEAAVREECEVREARHLIQMLDQLQTDGEHLSRAWKGKRRARCYRREVLRLVANHRQRCLDRLGEFSIVGEPHPELVDYRAHDIVGVVPTHVSGDNGKVQSVVRQGFTRGDTVLRRASVWVFKFTEATNGRVTRPVEEDSQ